MQPEPARRSTADLYDLPHLGALCRRIRESRGLRPTDLARRCGVEVSTVTRLEDRGSTTPETFGRYLAALQTLAVTPLPPQREAILHDLFAARNRFGEQQARLEALRFDLLPSPRRQPDLAAALHALEAEPLPAMLTDELWFIHAVNGAFFRLYGVDPRAPFLLTWPAWHVVAARFMAGSPPRRVYDDLDQHLGRDIVAFLESSYPLLFTLQMRRLISRLIALSQQNGHEFQHWWMAATAFNLPFDLKSLKRTQLYQGRQPIRVEPVRRPYPARLPGGEAVRFDLTVIAPCDAEAERVMASLRRSGRAAELYFTADYDRDGTFHANGWPEVQRGLRGQP